jgi:hypothetical protein
MKIIYAGNLDVASNSRFILFFFGHSVQKHSSIILCHLAVLYVQIFCQNESNNNTIINATISTKGRDLENVLQTRKRLIPSCEVKVT